jgi:hypothetical protein
MDNAPSSSIPVDVATAFMLGVTEAGPTVPKAIDIVQNMDEYITKWAPGGRAYAPGVKMFNSAYAFFKRKGNRLFVGRVSGAAALAAKADVPGTGGPTPFSFTVSAKGVGEYANAATGGFTITIQDTAANAEIGAGMFRILVKRGTTILEASFDLADALAAQAWSLTTSKYVNVVPGAATEDPAPADYPMAGGASDIAGITDASWTAAVNNLSKTLGPGTLSAPGATTDSIHIILAKNSQVTGRVAFLDGPDTASDATLIAASKAVVDDTGKRARFAGIFAPMIVMQGETASEVFKVAPAPVVQAIFAANMAGGLSANAPAAGENGRLEIALDLTQTYTDAQRQSLNENGVNILRDIYGTNKVYGWRTTADPVNDKKWIGLGNSLLHRQIVAVGGAIGERFVFREIDGQGKLFGEFNGALVGELCMPLYLAGSLFGATASEAYKVDTGPSVNTIATIAANQLRAVISVRMSPFSEQVDILIVKYLVTESIPA